MASASVTEAGPQDSTGDSGDGQDSQLLENIPTMYIQRVAAKRVQLACVGTWVSNGVHIWLKHFKT